MERDKVTKRADAAQAERAAMKVLQIRDAESNALHFVLGYIARGKGKGLDGDPLSIKDAIESARHMFPTLTDEQARSLARTLNVEI